MDLHALTSWLQFKCYVSLWNGCQLNLEFSLHNKTNALDIIMFNGYGTVHPRPYAHVRVMTKPFSGETRVCCEELLLLSNSSSWLWNVWSSTGQVDRCAIWVMNEA